MASLTDAFLALQRTIDACGGSTAGLYRVNTVVVAILVWKKLKSYRQVELILLCGIGFQRTEMASMIFFYYRKRALVDESNACPIPCFMRREQPRMIGYRLSDLSEEISYVNRYEKQRLVGGHLHRIIPHNGVMHLSLKPLAVPCIQMF